MYGVPQYSYIDCEIIRRPDEDVEADRPEITPTVQLTPEHTVTLCGFADSLLGVTYEG